MFTHHLKHHAAALTVGAVVLAAAATGCSPVESRSAGPHLQRPAIASPAAGRRDSATSSVWWEGRVHTGAAVDPTGAVPPVARGREFAADRTFYLSMEVPAAAAGSGLRLTLDRIDSRERLWLEERHVEAGQSRVTFVFEGRCLPAGEYRARITVAGEPVFDRRITVSDA